MLRLAVMVGMLVPDGVMLWLPVVLLVGVGEMEGVTLGVQLGVVEGLMLLVSAGDWVGVRLTVTVVVGYREGVEVGDGCTPIVSPAISPFK